MPSKSAQAALSAINQIPAMVAYWDCHQRCLFSNNAYREWFGKTPTQMVGMTLEELLGPIYEKNLPFILGALEGKPQSFERQIPMPNGSLRESMATYTPDIVEGVVRGFTVHVADVTLLRQREAALECALRERDEVLAEIRTLRGLLPICASCKSIRDADGQWEPLEKYVSERSEATFSHGICPECVAKLYPSLGRGQT